MKRRWMALAALALLAAGVVYAQSVVQDGQSTRQSQLSQLGGHLVRSDSTQDANSGDGSGNLYVTESAPVTTFFKKRQGIINATLYHTYARISTGVLKGPQSDSCDAQDMIGCNRMAIALRYTLDDSTSGATIPAANGCGAILMIQVRGHHTQAKDSTNTFVWRWNPREDVALSGVTAIVDTIGDHADDTFNALTDTVNAGFGERPVLLNRSEPFRSLWIPLVNPKTGEWFAAPYVSIRVRVIRTFNTAAGAWMGTAAPPTTIQADLVGWR